MVFQPWQLPLQVAVAGRDCTADAHAVEFHSLGLLLLLLLLNTVSDQPAPTFIFAHDRDVPDSLGLSHL